MKKVKFPAWADSFLVFSVLAILYYLTASNRLTWANFGNDGGDFFAAILTNGIPHPTGYPTYLILGWLFQQLPVGDAYFRAVLLSLIPAAIASGLLCAWVNSLGSGYRLAGLVASLMWGLSPLFWSQAVIIEVYALQALFSVLTLWWVTLLLMNQPAKPGLLFLLAFSFGLGTGNHITQVFFLPVGLVGLAHYVKTTGKYRQGALQLVLVFLGGLVYLVLPLRAAQYPPINWGNPQTLSGFLWEVTGQPYQSLLGSISATTLVERLFGSASILREQVGVVGIGLGVIGGYEIFQSNRKLGWVGLWIFFVFLAFAILYNTADSTAYLIPAWMIFTGWVGISLVTFDQIRWKQWRLSYLLFAGLILWLGFRIPTIITQVTSESGYRAADIAEQTLQKLPEDAIVLTSSDLDSFPLWAYHFGLGWRKDIAVVVLPLTQFRWYQETLIHTYPTLNFAAPTEPALDPGNWGEQMGPLNPGRVLCRSTIKQVDKIEIQYTCTNGIIISGGS